MLKLFLLIFKTIFQGTLAEVSSCCQKGNFNAGA
jgi:hypothetical protein